MISQSSFESVIVVVCMVVSDIVIQEELTAYSSGETVCVPLRVEVNLGGPVLPEVASSVNDGKVSIVAIQQFSELGDESVAQLVGGVFHDSNIARFRRSRKGANRTKRFGLPNIGQAGGGNLYRRYVATFQHGNIVEIIVVPQHGFTKHFSYEI